MKKKKIFVMLLAVLVLIVVAIFILPQIKKGYLGETVTVYMPSENISSGTQITEEIIKQKSMPTEFVDKEKLIDKEELIGKYTKYEVFATDYFTKEKIANIEEQALYEDVKLVSITLSKLSSSVGAKISPGDCVNIYGYTEGYEGKDAVTFPDLKEIEVAYILNNQGKNVKDDEENGASSIPAAAVLKVKTQQQVDELLKLEYTTKIHLERVHKQEKNIENKKGEPQANLQTETKETE